MIVERPYWIAGATAAVAALALVIGQLRGGRTRRPAVDPASAVAPAEIAAQAAPEPAASGDSAPETDASTESAVPVATLPCFDDRAELLADGGQPLLCWSETCLSDLDDPTAVRARPAPPAQRREAVVSADKVCSGKRCDRLGPALRQAVADVDASSVWATRDHAAVVVTDSSGSVEAWNRAADRPIDFGPPPRDEGDVVSVDVLGDKLIVTRSCSESCDATARIVDASGHGDGDSFAIAAASAGESPSLVALGRDRAVAFGRSGTLTLIAGGRIAASASLLPAHARAPQEAAAQAVRLDDSTLAAAWCTGGKYGRACHLTRIVVDQVEDSAGGELAMTLESDHLMPRCPVEN